MDWIVTALELWLGLTVALALFGGVFNTLSAIHEAERRRRRLND